MSMLNVLANQHAVMMPDEYKHRSDDEMKQRVLEIKRAFGSKLFIPGHHYQKDEVIEFRRCHRRFRHNGRFNPRLILSLCYGAVSIHGASVSSCSIKGQLTTERIMSTMQTPDITGVTMCIQTPTQMPTQMNRIDLPHLLWSLESIEKGSAGRVRYRSMKTSRKTHCLHSRKCSPLNNESAPPIRKQVFIISACK
ncbi:Quinolinate synthase A [Bacillus safensis subsp. safensis]